MAWAIEHDFFADMIELTWSGLVTGNDIAEASTKRISLQKETGISRVLIDVSAAKLIATLFDLLILPERLYDALGANPKDLTALVLPVSDKEREDWLFFEMACTNRGWIVKAFPERERAMDWLLRT